MPVGKARAGELARTVARAYLMPCSVLPACRASWGCVSATHQLLHRRKQAGGMARGERVHKKRRAQSRRGAWQLRTEAHVVSKDAACSGAEGGPTVSASGAQLSPEHRTASDGGSEVCQLGSNSGPDCPRAAAPPAGWRRTLSLEGAKPGDALKHELHTLALVRAQKLQTGGEGVRGGWEAGVVSGQRGAGKERQLGESKHRCAWCKLGETHRAAPAAL